MLHQHIGRKLVRPDTDQGPQALGNRYPTRQTESPAPGEPSDPEGHLQHVRLVHLQGDVLRLQGRWLRFLWRWEDGSADRCACRPSCPDPSFMVRPAMIVFLGGSGSDSEQIPV